MYISILQIVTIIVATTIVVPISITTASTTMTTVLPSSPIVSIDESMQRLSTSDHNDNHDVDSDHHIKQDDDPFQYPLIPPSLPISEWPYQSILLQAGIQTNILHPMNTSSSSSSSSSSSAAAAAAAASTTTTKTTTTTTTKPSLSSSLFAEQHLQQQQSLPIGIPIDFETPIFRGQFLVRLRNITSNNTNDTSLQNNNNEYFINRNRIMQTVVQGKFKKNIKMSDLYVGCIFRIPMKYAPPPFFMRILRGLFHRIAPGAILDFTSDKPRIITLYAGTAKAFRIDLPGQQPDITSYNIQESVHNLDQQVVSDNEHASSSTTTKGKRSTNKRNRKNHYHNNKNSKNKVQSDPSSWSIQDRKRILSNPELASQYEFDTDHIYTMEIYDEAMDYLKYEIKLPIYGNFNFSEAIGIQPMTFTAITKQNEILYDFAVWHESIIQRQSIQTITSTE